MLIVYATLALLALSLMVWVFNNPEHGVYAFIFGSAILVSMNLPVVREKLAGCDFLMLATLMSLFVLGNPSSGRSGALEPKQRQVFSLAVIYIIVCGTSALVNLVNLDSNRAFVEIATYIYGLLTAWVILQLITDEDKWRKSLYAWSLGACLVGWVGVLSVAGIYNPLWIKDEFTGRVSSTLRESGQVSSYCGPIFPLLIVLSSLKSTPKLLRRIFLVSIVPIIIVIMASGSRIAFLILVLGLVGVFFIILTVKDVSLSKAGFTIIVVAVIGGLGNFIYTIATDTDVKYAAGRTSPLERPIRMIAEMARGEKEADDTRLHQVAVFKERFWNHPILGAGPANYSSTYKDHEIHNSYLATLSEAGIAGFLALMLWIFSIGRLGIVTSNESTNPEMKLLIRCFLFGFSLLLVYQITTLGIRQRPWWFTAALMLCLPKVLKAEKKEKTEDDSSEGGSNSYRRRRLLRQKMLKKG